MKTAKQIAEQRAIIKKRKVEAASIVEKANKKTAEKISHRNRFIILENTDIPRFFDLSGPMALYFYLLSSVNRNKNETFGNLGSYYQRGYLATIRTQSYIEREMSEKAQFNKRKVNRQNIGNWLQELEELDFIRQVGTEVISIGGSYQDVPVWALGEIVFSDEAEKEEVLFFECF